MQSNNENSAIDIMPTGHAILTSAGNAIDVSRFAVALENDTAVKGTATTRKSNKKKQQEKETNANTAPLG